MPKGLRGNPLFQHASLMQSGFVQARIAPPAARAVSRIVARSFDDGRDVGPTRSEVEPDGGSASQYDVLAANPGLDVAHYEEVPVTAAGAVGESVHECDVSAANPSFDPTPYEPEPGEPQEAEVAADQSDVAPAEPAATRPVATPSRRAPARKPTAASNGAGQPAPGARVSSFTAREMDKLVQDEDFRADLDAILGAAGGRVEKPPATGSTPAARRQPPVREEQPRQSRARSRVPTPEEAAREISDAPSEHAIFDKIAENMQFATAYDLPPVNLSRRFDSFDRQGPRRPPAARSDTQSKPAAAPPEAAPAQVVPSPATSSAPAGDTPPEARTGDRQDVAPAVPSAETPRVPPAPPQTLRPYSAAEKVATYGDARVDPEAWAAENVIDVLVPQLAGVPGPDGAPSDGTVAFHKLGMRSLSDLFAAWELAGLMSKVMSFDGAHAAQSPHGEGVDAHAWAIAFDINAKWNPGGDEPLPKGTEGSVAELVEIANRHGFVWGGHDPRRKAGLHFELGQRI